MSFSRNHASPTHSCREHCKRVQRQKQGVGSYPKIRSQAQATWGTGHCNKENKKRGTLHISRRCKCRDSIRFIVGWSSSPIVCKEQLCSILKYSWAGSSAPRGGCYQWWVHRDRSGRRQGGDQGHCRDSRQKGVRRCRVRGTVDNKEVAYGETVGDKEEEAVDAHRETGDDDEKEADDEEAKVVVREYEGEHEWLYDMQEWWNDTDPMDRVDWIG